MSITSSIDSVFRDYNTPGVPSSGGYNPNKKDIRSLLKQMAGGTSSVGDFRGAWSNATAYIATDLVERGGSIWYAKADSLNVTPVEGATWTVFLPGASVADGSLTEPKAADAFTLGLVRNVTTISALAGVPGSRYVASYVTEDGREGIFRFLADASAKILGPAINSSAVDATTETITSNDHGMETGHAVVATTAVNGLALNTLYYIIRASANGYKLATSFVNAKAGTAFNLTGTTATTVKRHFDPLQGIYVTPTADISGASGAWVRNNAGSFDVKWFGAKGTGATDDDTHAIQAAFHFANQTRNSEVFFPPHSPAAYYQITKTVILSRPIRMRGAHQDVTIAQVGMTFGTYMFHVDGSIAPNLEKVFFEDITIRPWLGSGDRAHGILVTRAADLVLRNVTIYTPAIGVLLTGNRGYSTKFDNVQFYQASMQGVLYTTFTGGGQHEFKHVKFTSCAMGFHISADSQVSTLSFDTCGWEVCAVPFEVLGELRGCTFDACYTEGNTTVGGASFRFIPSTGKPQRGIVFSGGYYHTDAEAYVALLGGDGTVSAFRFENLVTDGHSAALIRKNGAGGIGYGSATDNFLDAMPAVVSNGPISALTLSGNHNNSGAVAA